MSKLKVLFSKKVILLGIIYSCLLTFVFLLGRKINYNNPSQYIAPFKPIDLLSFVLLALLIAIIFFTLYFMIAKTKSCEKASIGKRYIFIFAGIVLLLWLPYYLTYFPANLSSDSLSIVRQALDDVPLYNHHPILYTLFIKLFVRIGMLFGDVTAGVGLAMFAQMCIMALVFGYFLWWSYAKGLSKWIFVCFVLFFSINPAIAIYSLTMWKDVLFSAWVLLLCMFLYDVIMTKGECLFKVKGYITLVILCLFVCFARNNGIFVVAFSLFILCLIFRKQWKKCLPLFIGILFVVKMIQGPLYECLDIENSGFAESVAIPIQQIGYTVWSGGQLTPEQTDELNKIMSTGRIKENYDPKLSDSIKFNIAFNADYLNEHKVEFLKLWFSILPSHFNEYVTGYLLQTSGYWSPGVSYRVCRYGVIPNEFEIKGKNMTTKTFYNLMLPEKIQAVPVIGNIYNVGYMVWFCLFVCFMLAALGRAKQIFCLCPLLSLWGTMLIAAPLFCDFRYMYAFHIVIPFLVLILCKKDLTSDGEF